MFRESFDVERKKKMVNVYINRLNRKLQKQLKRLIRKNVQVFKKIENYDSHLIDDLPLTISRSKTGDSL